MLFFLFFVISYLVFLLLFLIVLLLFLLIIFFFVLRAVLRALPHDPTCGAWPRRRRRLSLRCGGDLLKRLLRRHRGLEASLVPTRPL